MPQHRLHHTLGGFVILMAVLACALSPQAVQPTSGIDPNAVETAIVGTLQASGQQTEQVDSMSPTPALPTVTSTPRVSLYGTSLWTREDQSSVFVDHKAGIQLVIPAGWLPVRVNEEEYYKAFTSEAVLQNPIFHDHLTRIQDVKLDVVRLDAIDIRPGHAYGDILSNFNVIFEAGDTRSLEDWERAERRNKLPYSHSKFISSSYPQVGNGTQVLLIERSWDASGNKGTIYYRGIFFSLPTGTIVLDLYTNFDYRDVALPDFDVIVNGLMPIQP
jgi:hypothetical protein